MTLFVDTSVWSLALRRDAPADVPEAATLLDALRGGDNIVTTGLVLQELLQGFAGPRARRLIVERFAALPAVVPDRRDHIEAAELRNSCRRKGLQLGTIDALFAQICTRHGLLMLTTDRDFHQAARHIGLRVWSARSPRH
jgi:predicted nucleic acid-binding protein